MDIDAVRKRLEALIAKHGTQKAAAAALGLSPVYFSDVLNGKRHPGAKVLKALGLTATTVYR